MALWQLQCLLWGSNELRWEDHAFSAEFGIQPVPRWTRCSGCVQVTSTGVSNRTEQSSPLCALQQSRITLWELLPKCILQLHVSMIRT